MKKQFILTLFAVISSLTASYAQSSFAMEYAIGFGGETKSYVSTASFRGVMLEWKGYLQPNVSLGIDAGWNLFYEQRPYDTYTVGTASLSGKQYRTANAVPIYFTFNYFLQPGEHLNPFVGAGVGTLYYHRNTDMGIFYFDEEAWHFSFKPEVGVLVNASPDMDFALSLKYFYGFETSNAGPESYFTFNVGFVFK